MRNAKIGLTSLLLVLALGCTLTVRPRIVTSSEISYSGNVQNGGIIGTNAAGSLILSADSRNKYNGLIDVYAASFIPPLHRDAGITATETNTFLIDKEHWEKALIMNWWRKQGVTPESMK